MKKWEYKTLRCKDPEQLALEMSYFGLEGWKIVSIVYVDKRETWTAFMEREVPEVQTVPVEQKSEEPRGLILSNEPPNPLFGVELPSARRKDRPRMEGGDC